jgi:hypothetical protein
MPTPKRRDVAERGRRRSIGMTPINNRRVHRQ